MDRTGISYNLVGALYLHVPFCRSKCRYCDFYSLADKSEGENQNKKHLAYVRAVVCDLGRRKDILHVPLASVFVGGGTPSILGPKLLPLLLEPIKPLIDENTEFTVETNPSSLDAKLAGALVQMGVNRLTVGAQSFQENELRLLGRIHNSEQTRRAVSAARKAGITNIAMDLIYAIPGQSLENWKSSLQQALDIGIEHLSCYALSFERGTALYDDLSQGKVHEVDETLQKEMYQAAQDLTRQAGMLHYEISNFALPARQCLHNLTYWRNEEYLGLGPAAASYIAGRRSTNHADLDAYINAIENNLPAPSESEHLQGRQEMAETVMLALRLIQGLDRKAFIRRFNRDVLDVFPKSISQYHSLDALTITPTHIKIPNNALFVSDTILADILAEAI